MAQTINPITSYFDEVFSDLSSIQYGTGFLSIFANSGPGSKITFVENATQIAVDLIRGQKTIAKLLERSPVEGGISLGENARHTKAQKFQNAAYDFPIIPTWGSVTYSEALKYRIAGRVDTDISMDVIMKAREKFGDIILANIKSTVGRMEAEAAEALTTGKITLDDGYIYDLDRSTDLTVTPTTLWSVVATASPIGDIDGLIDAGKEKGRVTFKPFVFGYEAWEAFLKTNEITNIADNRRLHFVQAGDQVMLPPLPSDIQYMAGDNRFTYVGYLITYKGRKVYCFVYDEEYENASGTSVPFLGSKDVVGFAPSVRRDRYMGPRIRFDLNTADEVMMNRLLGLDGMHQQAIDESDPAGVVDARMFHHDAFLSTDKTAITIETYSGPLFIPTHIDGSGLLDEVTA